MRTPPIFRLLCFIVLCAALPAAAFSAEEKQDDLARLKQAVAMLQREVAHSNGKQIYDALCATCHGYRGNGVGSAAARFAQRPTDFTQGVYKLRSTVARVPLAGDVERSIRDGMPGTEMVPYRGLLNERGIASVAAYVRALSTTPTEPAQEEEARTQKVDVPTERPFAATAESIAKGKDVFAARCAECHGDAGEGSTKEKDDWGFPVQMMDFRQGVFKAGTTDGDLYRVILTGMNGTSMGAYQGDLSTEEAWNVVDFMRTLKPQASGPVDRIWTYLLRDRPSGFNYGAR